MEPLTHNILVLSEIFPPIKGGSGKWLYEIYARMPNASCIMVVGKANNSTTELQDCEIYSQTIQREDLSMAFRGVANFTSLRRYCQIIGRVGRTARRHRVRAIHAARPLYEGLVARALRMQLGLPYICFVHGEDINVARTSRELTWLTTSVLKNADQLIANSNFTKELLLNEWQIPNSRIALMHPGVDCNFFTPTLEPSGRRIFPENRPILLTVGRLQERKGHDTLIQGLVSIRKAFPNILYAIAGDGEQREYLDGLVASLDLKEHVVFLNEIDDDTLRQCYRECDLFVLPNRTLGKDVEGFGIVLIEAQACGKPVIAGKSGGTCDTLLEGQTGLIVDCQDPKNPEDLVKAVCSLLGDAEKIASYGTAARTFVKQTFDWPLLAKQADLILRPRDVATP